MKIHDVGFSAPFRPGSPGGPSLAATLYLPEPAHAAPALLVGHGADSHRGRHQAFCRVACDFGFAVLALDFRGHGDSEGTADGPLDLDILAAATFLRGRSEVNPDRICYRGSSMGGFYGLKAAAAARLSALALLCPAGEAVMLAAIAQAEGGPAAPGRSARGGAAPLKERRGAHGADEVEGAAEGGGGATTARWDLPAMRAYFAAQDSLALAPQITCPVLLIHARGDRVVPVERSLELGRRLAGETTLMLWPGGSHTSAQHDPRIHLRTAQWLWEQVCRPPSGRRGGF